jgi:hypothetical protein
MEVHLVAALVGDLADLDDAVDVSEIQEGLGAVVVILLGGVVVSDVVGKSIAFHVVDKAGGTDVVEGFAMKEQKEDIVNTCHGLGACFSFLTNFAAESRVTIPVTGESNPTSTWSNILRASNLTVTRMTLLSLGAGSDVALRALRKKMMLLSLTTTPPRSITTTAPNPS